MCVASSSEYDKLEIKDHFILANTNKNFKLQFIISIVAIFLSIIITIDKIYLTKN